MFDSKKMKQIQFLASENNIYLDIQKYFRNFVFYI